MWMKVCFSDIGSTTADTFLARLVFALFIQSNNNQKKRKRKNETNAKDESLSSCILATLVSKIHKQTAGLTFTCCYC